MKDKVVPAERAMRETRLAGFAKSHFIISGVGFCVLLPLCAIISQTYQPQYFSLLVLADILLLLAYMFAGSLCAGKGQWGPFGSWKEGLWAFLDPALIAWGWAALVVLSLALNSWPLLLILFCASLFLASPSALMVLLLLRISFFGWPGLILGAVLAGGLPPLLFFLGSLLAGKQKTLPEASSENGV